MRLTKDFFIKTVKISVVSVAVLSLFGCISKGPEMHSQSQQRDDMAFPDGLFAPSSVNKDTDVSAQNKPDLSNSSNTNYDNHLALNGHGHGHGNGNGNGHGNGNGNGNGHGTNNTSQSIGSGFIKASNIESRPVKYVPVPIPGQLKPIPKVGSRQAALDLKQAQPINDLDVVKSANQQAMIKPSDQGYFNSVMSYEYMAGAVYVVYTAPLNITDLMFEPGEKIISYPAGDSSRWQIQKTRSGAGAETREHLIIKPLKSSLENTLLVTTDKRVYHLVLHSTSDNTYMIAVKWSYPEDFLSNNGLDDVGFSPRSISGDSLTLDMANVNFDYQYGVLKGNKPNWFPARVFSSDRQTFIEFDKKFKAAELPMLYVKTDAANYATMVNWRLIGGRFMIVDQVISQAQLIMGVKSSGQTIVLIEQKK